MATRALEDHRPPLLCQLAHEVHLPHRFPHPDRPLHEHLVSVNAEGPVCSSHPTHVANKLLIAPPHVDGPNPLEVEVGERVLVVQPPQAQQPRAGLDLCLLRMAPESCVSCMGCPGVEWRSDRRSWYTRGGKFRRGAATSAAASSFGPVARALYHSSEARWQWTKAVRFSRSMSRKSPLIEVH